MRARWSTSFVIAIIGCGPSSPSPPPSTPSSATPTPSATSTSTPERDPTSSEPPRQEDDALPTYVPPPDAPYRAGTTSNAPPPNMPAPTPEEVKACAARGGKIEAVCMLGNLECVVRHRDAGKRCRDKRDCIGDCLYEGPQPAPANATGVCQRTSDPCGCRARVVGGRVEPTICGD